MYCTSPIAVLALSSTTREQSLAVLDALRTLARGAAALELSLAMTIGWLKRQDPVDLGYLTFPAFCRERVDWNTSWRNAMIRLVEGPFGLVKRAACEGLIPMRLAVKADCAPEDQAEWLVEGTLDAPSEPRELDRFEGPDAETIRKARALARLCLGKG